MRLRGQQVILVTGVSTTSKMIRLNRKDAIATFKEQKNPNAGIKPKSGWLFSTTTTKDTTTTNTT